MAPLVEVGMRERLGKNFQGSKGSTKSPRREWKSELDWEITAHTSIKKFATR
jgi:hypothetical protein